MSHFTTIKTKLRDKNCLIQALRNLNYIIKENATIRGYGSRTRTGDIVVVTGGSYDVGFNKGQDNNYTVVADWYGAGRAVGAGRNKFIQQVTQEYSIEKVLQATKKRGFRLSSRNLTENGETKLVVVKRGWSR